MSAAARPVAKSPARRKPEYVRPYLLKQEVAIVLQALEASEADAPKLIDPSLASAVAELRRWT